MPHWYAQTHTQDKICRFLYVLLSVLGEKNRIIWLLALYLVNFKFENFIGSPPRNHSPFSFLLITNFSSVRALCTYIQFFLHFFVVARAILDGTISSLLTNYDGDPMPFSGCCLFSVFWLTNYMRCALCFLTDTKLNNKNYETIIWIITQFIKRTTIRIFPFNFHSYGCFLYLFHVHASACTFCLNTK